MVYFTADQHFGHEAIIDYCNRPFESVAVMNLAMIDKWNAKVNRSDKIFVLGDFALGSDEEIIKWGRALNGYKTLILGNHDRANKSVYLEAGFSEVIKYPILWDNFYILSHDHKFNNTIGPYFNIYGHVHNDPSYVDVSPVSCCVSVERTDYAPLSFRELQLKVKSLLKKLMWKKCKSW